MSTSAQSKRSPSFAVSLPRPSEARHDAIAARAQAHPAQSRPLEGIPVGLHLHGYEFVAPLDADGRIDPELWHRYREHCGVRRFWEGEDEMHTFRVVSVEPAA
jgi:hypothetical protein